MTQEPPRNPHSEAKNRWVGGSPPLSDLRTQTVFPSAAQAQNLLSRVLPKAVEKVGSAESGLGVAGFGSK